MTLPESSVDDDDGDQLDEERPRRTMRGLPFPTDPTYREVSFDRDTPLTTVDGIAIDPALAGPVIDPAILAQETAPNGAVSNVSTLCDRRKDPDTQTRRVALFFRTNFY